MESAAVPTPGGASTPGNTTAEPDTALKRAVSRRMLTLFVLGDVLGAGVYALIGNVVAETGGAVWTAFLAAAVMAGFTAVSYAELVTKFPRAGGAAHYIQNAFHTPALTFTIAFAVMCTGLASAATLATAVANQWLPALLEDDFSDTAVKLIGVAFLIGVALINARGISESVKVNLGLTAIEVTGLLLVMIIGIAFFIGGDAQGAADADLGRAFEFKDGENVFLAVFAGAAVAFYALIGFEDSVNVAEETHDPPSSYPRALLLGLGAAALIYLAIGLVTSIAVPTGNLSDTDEYGPSLLQVVQLGPLSIDTKVFAAIALFALANGALINLIMASRLIYGMADQGIMPKPFRTLLPGRRTPWVAIVFTTLIAIGLVIYGELADLASTTVLLLVVVFAVVNGAVLVLRRVEVPHQHFKAPTILPALGIIASIGIIIQKVSDDSDAVGMVDFGAFELTKTVTIAIVLLALGFVLWAVNRLLGGERLTEESVLAAERKAGEE